ncbi:MAG: hypothetical protein KY397_07000 [Gemmatimonadetes bacterium]|nr:hypothetical protein [Gemmatimonadota bacterium]
MPRLIPIPLLVLFALGCGGTGGDAVPPETAEAVRQRIEQRIHLRNDTLRLARPGTQDTVALAFDHVHEEVRNTPGGRYVACVDFTAPGGEVWDLDYYVDEAGEGYQVEDVVIHLVGEEEVLPEGARRRLEQAR